MSKHDELRIDRRIQYGVWFVTAILGACNGVLIFGWSGLIPGFLIGWLAVLLVSSVTILVFVLRLPRRDSGGRQ